MKTYRNYVVLPALVLLIPVIFAACQSVATTSAKLRNQEGNYDIAIDLCRQALAENPDDAEAYFQLGFAYSMKDSVGAAYENFRRSAELDPKKARDAETNIQSNFAKHYKLGQSAFNRNDVETAAEEFKMATAADPRESVGYYNLGVAYSRLASDDESYRQMAIDAMDKVLEISDPSDANYPKALQVAGRQLAAAGREQEARDRFERLIEEDPTSYNVIEDIGNDMLNQQEWKGAVVFLKMASEARAKIDAEDFNLYYNIGAALYNLRKEDPAYVDEAIGYYQKALSIRDDEPQTTFNIAVAYVAKEDYEQAVTWLEKYASLDPSDPKGWQLLARSYSEMGEKDKAREAMVRFEQLSQ